MSDFDIRFGDSYNEIIQIIKKINATMMSLGHALYKGNVYVKPPSAKFTYVLMMDMESFVNKMMLSDVVGEDLVKLCRKIIEIMSHHKCKSIPKSRSNWDLIEVKDGTVSPSASEISLNAPLRPEILGKYPQEHMHQSQSLSNNQLRILSRICQLKSIFLTNITKWLTVNRFPHKCPKVVVAGPRDSGKSTRASVFLSIVLSR